MRPRYKIVIGSLVGAVAIHASFLACGGNGGTGGHGSDAGPLDAMFDAISQWIDGSTKDAMAAPDGGGDDGGSCGCTVTMAGPVQSTPASENPSQLKRGSLVAQPTGTIIASGPFVLTDLTPGNTMAGSFGANLVVQASAATCPALAGAPENEAGYVASAFMNGTVYVAVHGARYVIPAGQMLCAYAYGMIGSVQWAGFQPY
jgi:hypothetical protein